MRFDLIYLHVDILQRKAISSSSSEVKTTLRKHSNPLNPVQRILAFKFFFSHSYTVHLDNIKSFIIQLNAQLDCSKNC
jgi:hypothetical protein